MKIKIKKLKCLRCGNEWVPRIEKVKLCPMCKSKYWNQIREENKEKENKE
jgi:predicted Zn-ribbon and HTH transcriptional regulator